MSGPVVGGVALVVTSPEVHAAQVEAARNVFSLRGEGWEDKLARILWPDVWFIQEPREVRVIVNGETVTVAQPDD